MSPIREAREKIGWSVAHLVATACLTIEEILAIEGSYHVSYENRVLLGNIFAARGVKIDETAVVGPCDDASLATISLSEGQEEFLEYMLSLRDIGSRYDGDIRDLRFYRQENLIQVGHVRMVASFDGVDASETQQYFHIRLSERGRALINYRWEH